MAWNTLKTFLAGKEVRFQKLIHLYVISGIPKILVEVNKKLMSEHGQTSIVSAQISIEKCSEKFGTAEHKKLLWILNLFWQNRLTNDHFLVKKS